MHIRTSAIEGTETRAKEKETKWMTFTPPSMCNTTKNQTQNQDNDCVVTNIYIPFFVSYYV